MGCPQADELGPTSALLSHSRVPWQPQMWPIALAQARAAGGAAEPVGGGGARSLHLREFVMFFQEEKR